MIVALAKAGRSAQDREYVFAEKPFNLKHI